MRILKILSFKESELTKSEYILALKDLKQTAKQARDIELIATINRKLQKEIK